MAAVDEAEFIELVVASEKVTEWVERLKQRGNPARQKAAVLALKKHVESRSAYAEEARQAGVVPLLTRVLGLTEDEEVLDAASAIIAACAGPMAAAGKVHDYRYDGHLVRIQEGALGDGLGAKVWLVAHLLCLELARHPQLVAGQQVLEVGSGCGVCGIAAAALGAARVVLSDVEAPVLRNLRTCVHLNAGGAAEGRAAAAGRQGEGGSGMAVDGGAGCGAGRVEAEGEGRAAIPSDTELFDEAEEVEDFDLGAMMDVDRPVNATASGPGRRGHGPQAWEAGNMSVRLLDWAESVAALNDAAAAPGCCQGGGAAAGAVAAARCGSGAADEDLPPRVPAHERFPVLIGSEVMYERAHAELVAGVVAHKLAPGGRALFNCAVREVKVFDHFARECRRRGLRYRRVRVDPAGLLAGAGAGGGQWEGILGRTDEYEGGFLLMGVDHAAAPCADWHRDDWEEVQLE